MTSQTATPELRQWILDQARAGHAPDAVLAAMVQSGWDETVALTAMEETLQGFLADQVRDSQLPPPVPVPEPALEGSPATLQADGREVRVVLSMRNPRVVVFAGFLSDEECDALRALAAPRLDIALLADGLGRLSWSEVAGATGYKVWRADEPAGPWVLHAETDAASRELELPVAAARRFFRVTARR